jgi:hypothetical protein
MYTVLKKDTNGSAFWLWISTDKYTTAYVVKNDFSNLSGFPKEVLIKMAKAVDVYTTEVEYMSIGDICSLIKGGILFEA